MRVKTRAEVRAGVGLEVGAEVKAEAKASVKTQKTATIGVKVLLSSIKAFNISSTNLSLPIKGGLWQMQSLAI